ncbi:hypothetical protein PLESTF_001074100 [Pleodorina starrii]|nr:hypothetical protein PLESTF_001074100 [Pleodorina starrii]
MTGPLTIGSTITTPGQVCVSTCPHTAGGEYRQYETTKRSFNRFSSPPSLSAFAEVYGSAIGRCHVENRASARQLDRMNAIP